MVEYWNVDVKRMFIIYLIRFQEEPYNIPVFHFTKTHYSSVPIFQHSKC